MSTTNCITKSITLSPGEPFVLPAGATIIGATDVDAIDSTCADLTDLEEYQCYEMLFGFNMTDNDSVLDSDNTRVDVYLNNTVQNTLNYSDFVTYGSLPFPIHTAKDWLASSLPSNLIVDEVNMWHAHNNERRIKITFKTFPSIAATLKLRMRGRGFGGEDFNVAAFGGSVPEGDGTWVYPIISEDCEEIEE